MDEFVEINEAVRLTETRFSDLAEALIDYVEAIANARDDSE